MASTNAKISKSLQKLLLNCHCIIVDWKEYSDEQPVDLSAALKIRNAFIKIVIGDPTLLCSVRHLEEVRTLPASTRPGNWWTKRRRWATWTPKSWSANPSSSATTTNRSGHQHIFFSGWEKEWRPHSFAPSYSPTWLGLVEWGAVLEAGELFHWPQSRRVEAFLGSKSIQVM